ncbi:MAG: hypothetical protein JNL01_16750 [Bdellovibrionales bacterium]|nr:hypothetical protein [Bdellovibrionales bacterium]
MKTSNTILMTVLISSAAIHFSACEPLKAEAPKNPIIAPKLQEFPLTDYYLVNNKMFLWPVESSPAVVTEAVRIGRAIDDLDTVSFAYSKEEKTLTTDLAAYLAIKEAIKDIEKKIKTLDTTIKGRKTLIATEEKKPMDKQNPTNLAKWKNELAKAEQDRAIEAQNLIDQTHQAAITGDQLDPPTVESPKGPKRERMEFLANDRVRVEAEGTAKVDRMIQIVDWYKTQPSSISFRMTAANPVVELNGWDLSDDAGSRNFSSETVSESGFETPNLGTITNITYTVLGGVIRFNLGVFETTTKLTGAEKAAAVQQGYETYEKFYELEKEEVRLTHEMQSLIKRGEMKEADKVRGRIADVQQKSMALSWNPDLREVYSFRVARHAYEKTLTDGRLFFAGDLTRRRNPKGSLCEGLERTQHQCMRKGSIKLVDRNN